jgi:hypothetical protein
MASTLTLKDTEHPLLKLPLPMLLIEAKYCDAVSDMQQIIAMHLLAAHKNSLNKIAQNFATPIFLI